MLLRRWLIIVLVLAVGASACSYQLKSLEVGIPTTARSSAIYDSKGNVITYFRGEQHRLPINDLDEVPLDVQNAIIAIEDERFWQHSGVDLRAMLRAARSNISQGGISEGGSTITQQYVGLSFLDRTDRSTSRKIEEIALALQFERQYAKEYILREYLNVVYFGEGAYGIRAAAREYFSKDLNSLTIAEAALLAGLIQAPSSFNPYSDRDTASRRRNEVLERMLINNWISQKEFDTARTETIKLAPRVEVLAETYDAPHFVEEVRQWFLGNPKFGETRADRALLLFEGGLHIYTTLDPDIQNAAEAAIREILTDPEGPDSAVVVVENDTGFVRGLVGGRDFFSDSPEARFNLATQGLRQAGSTMKPIVLAAALENGFSIHDSYYAPQNLDVPIDELDEIWKVRGGRRSERVSLFEGLVSSVNTVYAQLSRDVDPFNSVNVAERLGFTSPLSPVLAFVLGSEGVTTLDMATVFSTFARRGIRVEPTFVTRIATSEGNLLHENALTSTRAIDRDISDQITEAMVAVVERGTGWRAQVRGLKLAGKTGTAEDFHDAAFAGFSPTYTTAVWVGFPHAQIAMTPPTTPIDVFGGRWPAQIFQLTMSNIAQDLNRDFSFTPTQFEPRDEEGYLPHEAPTYFEVPEVRELNRLEAVDLIYEAGFIVSVKETIILDPYDPLLGIIQLQEPLPGLLALEGSPIILEALELPEDYEEKLCDEEGNPPEDLELEEGETCYPIVEPPPPEDDPLTEEDESLGNGESATGDEATGNDGETAGEDEETANNEQLTADESPEETPNPNP